MDSEATHDTDRTHEQLTVNVGGKVRRETVDGRVFVVAPVTPIVPGVWPGSDGNLLYTPALLAKKPPATWNDQPLVLRHPKDGDTYSSARTRKTLAAQKLGRLYESDDGKTVEAWFDEVTTNAKDPSIIPALDAGKPLPGSTGIYTLRKKAPKGATWNDAVNGSGPKPYTHEVMDFAPDHYAVLPGGKGACDVKDGCGVLVGNEAPPDDPKERESWWAKVGRAIGLLPKTQAGVWEDLPKPADLRALTANELSFDQIYQAIGRALRAARTQDQPHCYVTAVYDDYFVYEEGMSLYRQDYAKTDTGVTLTGDPVQVVRQVSYEPVPGGSTPEGYTMNETEKLAMTAEITANCDCYKGQEALLKQFPEANLKAIHEKVMGEAKAKREAEAAALTTNTAKVPPPAPETPRLTADEQAALAWANQKRAEEKASGVARLTANIKDEAAKANAAAIYQAMPFEQIEKLVAILPVPETPVRPSYAGAGVFHRQPTPTVNAQDDMEEPLDLSVVYNEFEDGQARAGKKELAAAK